LETAVFIFLCYPTHAESSAAANISYGDHFFPFWVETECITIEGFGVLAAMRFIHKTISQVNYPRWAWHGKWPHQAESGPVWHGR